MSITLPKYLLEPQQADDYFELRFKTKKIERWFKKNNIENDVEKFIEACRAGDIFYKRRNYTWADIPEIK